jgi:hypothetical protein
MQEWHGFRIERRVTEFQRRFGARNCSQAKRRGLRQIPETEHGREDT